MSARAARAILLQEPRDFTVQILRASDEATLGTGVVVSSDGLVATCRHVLEAAGELPGVGETAPVLVRFPAWIAGAASTRPASVAAALTDYDDDFVCLLTSDPPKLDDRNVAKLGDAADCALHDFRSYGFRRLETYQASYADGTISGTVDAPVDRRLRLEPVQLQSQNIDQGMSGAGVLDKEKNLVVGLISETWYGGATGKDRDTGWAVNARIVSFTEADVPIHSSLPLQAAERPVRPVTLGRAPAYPSVYLDRAPQPLEEWVGRDDVLADLRRHWEGEDRHLVVGLIGFGGEGKTSVARRFIDSLYQADGTSEPDGVFWWEFSASAGSDEFLSALLEYLLKDRRVSQNIVGSARAEVAASLLDTGRYVLVLDGLDAVQFQADERYGALADPNLLAFLKFAAVPGHDSLCLVTSRAPVFDLLPYLTYWHADLDALSVEAGRELFRRLGVFGSDAAIDQVVEDWGRHALSLSLLASYLIRRYRGDVRRVSSFPPLDPKHSRDEMAIRILREYDSCLSDRERHLLIAFSVFRTPVGRAAIDTAMSASAIAAGDSRADESAAVLLDHLTQARIVHKDVAGRLAMHPLIRDYYRRQGARNREAWSRLHEVAKLHYLTLMGPNATQPTLHDLEPAIEAAHHACRSGAFDEASDIIYDHLYQGDRGLITRELNAYSTVLSVFQDFFPEQQLHRTPLVDDPETRSWIFHETATALHMLGRLDESAHLLRRAMEDFKQRELWHDAAISCQNLGELHLELGALAASESVIDEAFELAERAGDREDELVAHTLRGGLAHLRGQTDLAQRSFDAALRLARECTPLPILYSTSGLHYADHLTRLGRTDEARTVHEHNLKVCREAGWRGDEVHCLVGLGELALHAGDEATALEHLEKAVTVARGITRRDALIHALIGRARHAVLTGAAFDAAELNQAIAMAQAGGFRILEADARVLLARSLVRSDAELAWEIATHTDQASIGLGYHWGHVDAVAVLRDLREAGG